MATVKRKRRPAWRYAFDAAENQLTPRMESMVRSEPFANLMNFLVRAESAVRRGTEGKLRGAWHMINLPAASDVRKLSERIAQLERQVREVAEGLQDREVGERQTRDVAELEHQVREVAERLHGQP